MMLSLRSLIPALCLLVAAAPVHADALADLKAALQNLPSQQPLKATVSVKSQNRQGDEDETITESGVASIAVEDSAQGLLMQFAPDTLAHAQAEELAKEDDKKAKAPTSKGLGLLNLSAIRAMTMAGENLKRSIKSSIFKSEKADTWNGQPARLLTFEADPSKRSKQDQKYVKSFESTLQVWVAADGTPLESRTQTKISGRAFLVVSFEMSDASRAVYQRVGDRLIATRRESSNSGSGMGTKGEGKTEYSLQLR